MWEITQTDETVFEVRYGDVIVDTATTYQAALGSFASQVSSGLAALAAAGVAPTDGSDGLLPDRWVSVDGIAMSELTGDGRDFTQTKWSARDVNASTLPLMLQVENNYGHMSARWAGFFDTIKPGDATAAGGRFYNNEDGVRARDMMLSRQVGVSVDPGMVDAEFTCTEGDEYGFCVDGVTTFLAYEIIGATITPFPAFARAAIKLEAAPVTASLVRAENDLIEEAEALTAGAAIEIPVVIPAEWFAMLEPEIGDPILVRQAPQFRGDEADHWAVPLTITDDGRVFGHVAPSGQCHVGFPGECVTAPTSRTGYAFFHLGVTVTSEGELSTGVLSAACDHYPSNAPRRPGAAQQHYENTALQWADVRASNGVLGVWVCGALRSEITPAQLRVLRASGLSGDWEDRGGNLEMIAAQSVSVPGFPILREAMAASGLNLPTVHGPSMRRVGGRVVALSAAGVVRRPCPDCAARAASQRALRGDPLDPREYLRSLGVKLDRIEAILERVDQRTVPLRAAAAEKLRAQITNGKAVSV